MLRRRSPNQVSPLSIILVLKKWLLSILIGSLSSKYKTIVTAYSSNYVVSMSCTFDKIETNERNALPRSTKTATNFMLGQLSYFIIFFTI